MASYRVFQFSDPLPDDALKGDHIRVLQDGFSVLALVLPLLYIIWYRLWLSCLLYLAALAIVLVLADTINPLIGFFLNSLIGLYLGFEATHWRAAKLKHNGWEEVGVVIAGNHEEAEMRALATYYKSPREKPKNSGGTSDEGQAPEAFPDYGSPLHSPLAPARRRPARRVIGMSPPKRRGPGHPS